MTKPKADPSAPIIPESRPDVYKTQIHDYEPDYQNSSYMNNDYNHQQSHVNHEFLPPNPLDSSLLQEDFEKNGHPEEYNFHGYNNEEENLTCRLCLDAGSEPLIVPCSCKGTMKYVHRQCLDRWRALSPRAESFYRCDQCFTYYKFVEFNNKLSNLRYLKYIFFVGLDICIYLLLWQAAVLICTGTYGLIDYLALDAVTARWINPLPVGIAYYLYGNGLFFFLLGNFAIVFLIVLCIVSTCRAATTTMSPYSGYSTYNSFYFSDWFFFWLILSSTGHSHPVCFPAVGCCPIGAVNCRDCGSTSDCGNYGNCDVGDSGNGGGVLGVLLAIVVLLVIIIIIIGAIFGLIVTAFVLIGICQRHYQLLKKKDEVKYYIVKDLESDRNNNVRITEVI